MNDADLKRCFIWPNCTARAVETDAAGRWTTVFASLRSGGGYKLTPEAVARLTQAVSPVDERTRVRLTTMLVNMRAQGVTIPEITVETIERAQVTNDIPVDRRSERMLWFLGRIAQSVGDEIDTSSRSVWFPGLLACSESVKESETVFLEKYLRAQGWIEGRPGSPIVSVNGYSRLAHLSSGQDSTRVFVAMWFSPKMEQVYLDAIEPAILDAGFIPHRVGQGQTTDRIDDETEAAIRASRLIIADFTHDPGTGVRGSVYYEAGFARALNRPIIFTAEKGSDVHFNVDHFLRIEWEDPGDLRTKLTHRIRNLPELQL